MNFNWKTVSNAKNAVFIPIPINNRRDEFIPLFHASAYIKNAPNNAPQRATSGIVYIVKSLIPSYTFPFRKYIYITTNNAAPEFIPNIPASAKSFFVTPCNIVPAIAKAIPINNAISILGNLSLNITIS